MHIVNIYLPKFDNRGKRFHDDAYAGLRAELIQKFGGITQYDQVPAIGYWKENNGKAVAQDELIIYEVLCKRLSKSYWAKQRKRLEKAFSQDAILIRAHPIIVI